ncbi:Thymidylate synthase ThyX [Gemmata obscuriglobus]|uniref:Flavin-dependent thymidylate synthase n=1 Tax=Gemmata obscuriglobus TaxID=114 RepID=A0A2Z3GW82_9BACT|nr:FAD-dependent thymidylate synthase [Gemmata obscuriglobus]AWM38689.1 FAD-dependent thymidylate synthase [Gemmata obscuriglobus]QEG28345.1 Thymidylate synthase ThyX [Gemmata obscuriglobus]VTS06227.1 fad-dependent thymidylate synthase : Thymidylate synthase ThyX OS=Saccharopolyspora rectivirgula GN=thyX PE=3 SV=1: Thy1 [Gemmata obscuriglobus UQM 2246]
MKVITEPSVYVLGRQTVDQAELDRFLVDHGVSWESDSEVAGEVLTETAGRVCYMSFAKPRPGGNSAYLTHIKEVGHGSVLEHAVWNLLLTGVSRSLTHELVRHRAGFGFSQLSQRYVDESVAEYVEPDIIARDPELHAIWLESVKQSHAAYMKLADALSAKLTNTFGPCDNPNCERGYQADHLKVRTYVACPTCKGSPSKAWYAAPLGRFVPGWENGLTATDRRKAARQAARSVLPNATETKIFITANARALRHFMEQRGSVHAEPEIRKLSCAILDALQKDAPNLFSDYQKVPLPDGTFELVTQFKKV